VPVVSHPSKIAKGGAALAVMVHGKSPLLAKAARYGAPGFLLIGFVGAISSIVSVFLGFPQGRHFVHSFRTRVGCFFVAGGGVVTESGCSENVRVF
jgi:hypothetical protein